MKQIRLFSLLSLVLAVALILGCAAPAKTAAESAAGETTQYTAAAETAAGETALASTSVLSQAYQAADTDASYDVSTAIKVDLHALTDSVYRITDGGTYILTGTFAGQILIEAPDDEKVQLVLSGADISSANGPAIYAVSTDKLILTLAERTSSTLSDGENYTRDEEGADGAVYSKSDVSINGGGSLTVNGNTAHGVVSKDDLVISDGSITVTSVKDGLRGKDCVAICGGQVEITAGSDGIVSSETDAGAGYVVIDGGTISIVAANDGIQAENSLVINAGSVNITCGGGSETVTLASDAASFWGGSRGQSSASNDSSESNKGLKSGGDLVITQGTITLNAADDGIHAGGSVEIKGGNFSIRSGDDAIHADTDVIIGGGNFDIPYCYEGIEGITVTINAGKINIVSSDDGINAAGGADGSGFGGRDSMFEAQDGVAVTINGGTITIVSDGDSIDSNGTLTISGGTLNLTCNGNGNTALDANGAYTNQGGTITTNDGSENGAGMTMGGNGGMGHGQGGKGGRP